jgi:hypothetical protein
MVCAGDAGIKDLDVEVLAGYGSATANLHLSRRRSRGLYRADQDNGGDWNVGHDLCE